jgi:hypothetical protein
LDGTTSSSAATFDGTPARFAGVAGSQTFTVDPSFLGYTPTPIEVSVVVGSAPGADAGFSFIYESTDPSKFSGIGWNYIPGDGTWHTINFIISNDEFDSIWGYNFGLNSDSTSNSQYYIQSVTVTKLPTAAPGGLTATAASSSQINLSWGSVTGATSYDIYRGTTSGGEGTTPIATGITDTTYNDTLLNSSTAYYYTVEAVEGEANSPASNEAWTTTTAGIPGTPPGATATAVSTSQINLSWNPVPGATSYNIYRGATSLGEYATAIATGVTGTSYPDTGLSAGTTYFYTVEAVNTYGTGAASNEPSAQTVTANGNVLPAWISPTNNAIWNPSSHILTVTGPANIIADPGTDEPIIEASGSLAVVTIDPASGTDIHVGGLSLTNGASAAVTSLGSSRSITNYHLLVVGTTGATVAPLYYVDPTSTLDLADNDMAVLYGTGTSPVGTVQSELSQAYDNKQWDKPGLTSSVAATMGGVTALGFGEASTLNLSTFDGVTLGGNAVLVKYTVVGDTNLDGIVNGTDYNTVLRNFDSSGQTWTGGDFGYSGTVTGADYNDVIGNFDLTLASVLPGGAGGSIAAVSTGRGNSHKKVTTAAPPVAVAPAKKPANAKGGASSTPAKG